MKFPFPIESLKFPYKNIEGMYDITKIDPQAFKEFMELKPMIPFNSMKEAMAAIGPDALKKGLAPFTNWSPNAEIVCVTPDIVTPGIVDLSVYLEPFSLASLFPLFFILFCLLQGYNYILIFFLFFMAGFFGGIVEMIAAFTVSTILFFIFNYVNVVPMSKLVSDLDTKYRKRRV